MTTHLRLPGRGACTVSAEGDALVITLPKNEGPDNIERCHVVGRRLMACAHEDDRSGEHYFFYMQVQEAAFAAAQIGAREWGRLLIRNPAVPGLVHTFDVPGPFRFAVRQREDTLGLRCYRTGTRTESGSS